MKARCYLIIFILSVVCFIGCKSVDSVRTYNNSILWPFMGCKNQKQYVISHDSIAFALNDSLQKTKGPLSNEQVKKVVLSFEPETDAIIIFYDSLENFSHVHVYGRDNSFSSLKSDSMIYYKTKTDLLIPICGKKYSHYKRIMIKIRNCPFPSLMNERDYSSVYTDSYEIIGPQDNETRNKYGLW